MEYSVKWMDPEIYAIDWGTDGRIREKPFCELAGCSKRVSTEFCRPKPFCKDHVLENPYVKNMLKQMALIDPKEDRKRANAALLDLILESEEVKEEYESE